MKKTSLVIVALAAAFFAGACDTPEESDPVEIPTYPAVSVSPSVLISPSEVPVPVPSASVSVSPSVKVVPSASVKVVPSASPVDDDCDELDGTARRVCENS